MSARRPRSPILGGGGHDKINVHDVNASEDVTPRLVGAVTVDGGSGNDDIGGGAGDDHLIGGKGNDVLVGGDGKDLLDGGSGNDRLNGGAGVDNLLGGKGRNVFSASFDGDTTDSTLSSKNIMSPTASSPTTTAQAKPLAFFGSATGSDAGSDSHTVRLRQPRGSVLHQPRRGTGHRRRDSV
jgi:Ca2+-binding RTX toxin-like protein